jgi:hypothetical protein
VKYTVNQNTTTAPTKNCLDDGGQGKARIVLPFNLVDLSGKECQRSSNAWAVEGSVGALKTLYPDVSKQGIIVFDVPKGRDSMLKVSGDYFL